MKREAGKTSMNVPDQPIELAMRRRPIFKGRFEAGSPLAANIEAKIFARHTGRRVGTDLLLGATRDQEGGLRGALEGAGDLAGMTALYEKSGAEITIDLRQVRASAQVVEATVGECNNGDRSFHQKDSVLLTARVHRAARAAAPTSSAATPLYQKNANDGGCEQTVDKDGAHHCRPLKEYPRDMREAAKQIDRCLDEAVARDCPEARVLVKHRTRTVDGVKVTIPLAVLQGKEAPTTLQQRAIAQRHEDSARAALNSGPGYGAVGKPFNSGNGATARDFSAEGANDKWYGLHLDIPTRDLAAKLRLLVQPDGSLKDAPLCDTEINPDHPGLTKGRWTFGLDREGALIMGVHNGHSSNRCVGGGIIPVTTAAPPYRVPHFAIAPLLAGKIVSNKTHNKRERTRAKLNEE
eukprot:g13054.t1